ncbi:hypothetical protein [Ruegeria sp. AD91A]|uniref:hypothetical protein n=1 Tax=Ruegeria sp. AD91A TaxID=2293862 RepID=UPI0019686A53|nr:hypothetical protein [Ruegeria sp. AD91A]
MANAKVRALDFTLVKTVADNGATVRPDLLEGVWLASPYISKATTIPKTLSKSKAGISNCQSGRGWAWFLLKA